MLDMESEAIRTLNEMFMEDGVPREKWKIRTAAQFSRMVN